MSFKIGDRVQILQSATKAGVKDEEVGKVGVIARININSSMNFGVKIHVQMNEICKAIGSIPCWLVNKNMIKLLPAKNQQLLFNFMDWLYD